MTVLSDRGDGLVIQVDGVVLKGHSSSTNPADLARRLAVAAHPRLAEVLVAPVPVAGGDCGGTRPVWPTAG